MAEVNREKEKRVPSNSNDLLEADTSSGAAMHELLLEKADMYSGEMSMFLRSAALHVMAVESAAKQVVEAAKVQDIKMLERGINGLRILGF